MDRKKKLRLYQTIFLFIGTLIIMFTYAKKDDLGQDKIISKDLEKKIQGKIKDQKTNEASTFYNVKYSGLDLEGNRYTILSKEAISSEANQNIVNMKDVLATFYFKDNTILNITSKYGEYNNKNLDMIFKDKVIASYENSELFAEMAKFSSSNNLLTVSNNVKVVDQRGTMLADKLVFDIKSKTLNITSQKDKKIKSNITYK